MCGEAYWITYYYYYYYYYFISFFFSGMCDYIKERPVLLLLFPSHTGTWLHTSAMSSVGGNELQS